MSEKLVGLLQVKKAEIVKVRKIWISSALVQWLKSNGANIASGGWTAPNGWTLCAAEGRFSLDSRKIYFSKEEVIDATATYPGADFAEIQAALLALAEKVENPMPGFTLAPPSSKVAVVGFQSEDTAIIVNETRMFLSREVYRFCKNFKKKSGGKSWTSKNGIRIAFNAATSWEIRRDGDLIFFFIPKTARDVVSNLNACVQFDKSLLTFEQLETALMELAEVVRHSQQKPVPPLEGEELTYY
jgi:hypothetical protein